MSRVVLGNRHATDSRDNGETFVPMATGKRATVIDPPEGQSVGETFAAITDPAGVWAKHAVEGATPAWVATDSPALAMLLSEHFGGIEVRELTDPYDPDAKQGKKIKVSDLFGLTLLVPMLGMLLLRLSGFLKTNAGNDFQAAQMAGSASATAVAKWVGLTANVTAPAAGDTTLTGEITTAGGGLIRKAGTYAHTTGANTYTITTVFTANGTDALPVTIGKRGIFDAVTSGNMVFETLISPTATLSASGDSLTLTDTITM
jgi:hypothetical protein